MKRILVNSMMLFVALATLTLTSCKKSNEDLIIGKWNTSVATMTTTDAQGATETTDLSPIFKGFEFTEDGNGNAFVQLTEEGAEPMACTWTIEEDKLSVIITDMSMTMDLNILEIDKEKLVLESVSEVYGTTFTMHFEMKKAE